MMKTAFRYYGGKNIHLDWLLPLMPAAHNEDAYVEPFCGSCAVALNRKHGGRKRIILNDANCEVVNFFMALREQPELLTHKLRYSPHSKYELGQAKSVKINPDKMPDVNAARAFAIKINHSFSCISNWATNATFFNERRLANYADIAEAIRYFHFHNDDALKIIRQFDKPSVFIYADPPYLMETRTGAGYANELNNERDYHIRLLELATQSQAQFAISGYHSPLYDEALADWHCFECNTAITAKRKTNGDKSSRIEVLWCNYNPAELGGQSVLL